MNETMSYATHLVINKTVLVFRANMN